MHTCEIFGLCSHDAVFVLIHGDHPLSAPLGDADLQLLPALLLLAALSAILQL